MSDNPPNEDEESVEGLADRAKRMLDKVKGERVGDEIGARIVDAAGGLAGGATAAAGGLADKARGLIGGAATPDDDDSDSDDSGANDVGIDPDFQADEVSGAADDAGSVAAAATGSVVAEAASRVADAGGGIGGKIAGAASGPSDVPSGEADPKFASPAEGETRPPIVTSATTAAPVAASVSTDVGGSAFGGSGGSGGSGSSGGSGDDDEKLFAELPISGRNQILWLGLIVGGLLMFGGAIFGLFSDSDSTVSTTTERASRNIENTAGSAEVGVGAFVENRVIQTGTADSSAATAATSTSEAPSSSTTEGPVDTTVAPTTSSTTATTSPAPTDISTLWDVLNDSGLASEFATISGALGLQEDLEALVDGSGAEVNRTLFAPSDAAMALLDADTLTQLVSNPDGASALVGYHFVGQRLSADDIAAMAGQEIVTQSGLPLRISLDGADIVLNDTTRLVASDLEADNGIVHIIDLVLDPPTVNEVVGLEPIEFEVSSDVITAAGRAELQKAIDFFAGDPNINAVIQGHTDTDGDAEANQDLSERRAESVKSFLIESGIAENRLSTAGFGESQPILGTDGDEDKAKSRRIEFVVQ